MHREGRAYTDSDLVCSGRNLLRALTPENILPLAQFARERPVHHKRLKEIKAPRRVAVGPFVTFYFENFHTLWWQVQEMLRIEDNSGLAHIQEEIDAYVPLLPRGREWTATVMFEIPDATERKALLNRLGHVETCFFLAVGGERIQAQPTDTLARTTPDGKTSAVHFIRFPLTESALQFIEANEGDVTVEITHPEYAHRAQLSPAVRAALKEDLDL